MRMFDDNERVAFNAYQHGESLWTFLNRSNLSAAEEMRNFMEDLLSEYPESGKGELIARLRSDEFDGAYFELLLHALLLRHGAQVKIHSNESSGNSTRPDFLATFPSGSVAIFEAVVSKDISARDEASEAGWSQLFHEIDQMPSGYYIGIDLPSTKMPDRPPASRRVLAFLKRELAKLDTRAKENLLVANSARDNVTFPTSIFKDGDIIINFTFLPRDNTQRGRSGSIGIYPSKSRGGGSSRAIKTAVEAKASKYGDVEVPYVVVVNSLSQWLVDTDDEVEALFGNPQIGQGGALLRSDGFPQNTRVSGVAIGCVSWRPGIARLRLYENPSAQQFCGEIPWRLDRMRHDGSANVLQSGESIGQILDLPTEWPGDFLS